MPKEKNKVDINKHEIDIDNLFKQNVNDLSAIKELYRKLQDIENKISQIKYIDTALANKLKKEYEKLKKIFLDENIQAKLTNDIKTINSHLDTMEKNKVQKNPIYIVSNLTADGIIEKIEECKSNGGGTVLLQSTTQDVIIDKYINVPCKVTLDFSHNKIVLSNNPQLKNGFIFGMNTTDGINWDSQYSTDKCEIRNAFIEGWNSPVETKGVHVLSKMSNINNIKFSNFRKAIVKDKYYTDLFTIDKCDFVINNSRYNDDFLITISGSGDGLLINQLHFSTGSFNENESVYRNGIFITSCNGGKLTNIINSNIEIHNSSELIIENYHSESGIFNISNSSLTLKNSSFLNTKNNHFITLGTSSDAYNQRCNKITLDNVYFSFSNTKDFRPQKQIFDINVLDNSLINIRNCFRRCGTSLLGLSIARNGESFKRFNKLSSKSSLNCNIIADKVLNDYSFNTFGGNQNTIFNLSEGNVKWNSSVGTYYYIFQVLFDEDRKLSTISNEVSFTNTGKSINFNRGSYSITNCMLRIYRGTQSDVYTHFVDLPILYDWNNVLTDFGNDIGGYYWNSLPSTINKEDLISNNNPCNQIEINNINLLSTTFL